MNYLGSTCPCSGYRTWSFSLFSPSKNLRAESRKMKSRLHSLVLLLRLRVCDHRRTWFFSDFHDEAFFHQVLTGEGHRTLDIEIRDLVLRVWIKTLEPKDFRLCFASVAPKGLGNPRLNCQAAPFDRRTTFLACFRCNRLSCCTETKGSNRRSSMVEPV
jgi:hypothetical protein